MDPSQLRQLAEDHAHGRLEPQEYRARRRQLIDSITAGETAISRLPPSPEETLGPVEGPHRRDRWLLASIVVGAVVVAALSLSGSPPPSSDPATMPQEVDAPRSTVTPARSLVESFLARRNFSAGSMQEFEDAWDALPGADHRQARTREWFASLAFAIETEVETQLALATLSDDDGPRERARRLRSFAGHIGVTLPEDDAGSTATPSPGQPDGIRDAQNIDPVQWLSIQPEGNVTLQLFAVNRLDHVDRLMQRYRGLELHILRTRGSPLYRVVHGSFPEVDQAKQAYGALPEAIRDASGGAIVKSMSALREDLDAAQPVAKVTEGGYTLQLFATNNEASAQALVSAHPDLSLRAARTADRRAPHRVLLGRFQDIEQARRAREALPASLIEQVGRPLIKRMESLQVQ